MVSFLVDYFSFERFNIINLTSIKSHDIPSQVFLMTRIFRKRNLLMTAVQLILLERSILAHTMLEMEDLVEFPMSYGKN